MLFAWPPCCGTGSHLCPNPNAHVHETLWRSSFQKLPSTSVDMHVHIIGVPNQINQLLWLFKGASRSTDGGISCVVLSVENTTARCKITASESRTQIDLEIRVHLDKENGWNSPKSFRRMTHGHVSTDEWSIALYSSGDTQRSRQTRLSPHGGSERTTDPVHGAQGTQ